MSLISLVIPVYHNATSLPDLLQRFQQLAGKNAGDQFEFVFVDDGSQDNSLEVLQSLQSREPRLRIVKLSRNFGSNAAIIAGMSQAKGAATAVIAADLQDPPELIHEMLQKWRAGHKVVLAARETRDDPGLTAFFADCFYSLFRRFAIKSMPKHGFDFFLIDRKVRDLINGIQESNPYLMGLILWLGFEPVVIPYHRQEREARYGQSMWNLTRKIKYFIDSFAAFSYVPIRLASMTGIGLSFIGFLYAIFVVGARLFFQVHTDGWASLMVVLLVVSGAQMTMTGILGEYMWRNLEETRKRPRFVVDTVIDAGGSQQNAALESQRIRSDAA